METGSGFEVNEIPVVKNGKTIALVGSMVDVTEQMQVEEGLAEAEFLIKDLKGGKRSPARAVLPVRAKGPLEYFRSLFSREAEKEEK